MRTGFIFAGLVSAVLIGNAPAVISEASANPLTCEHRSTKHLDEHGGRAVDDAWHVSHGQLPSCEASEGIEPKGSDNEDNTDTDEKSRYCRKHFFC